MRFINWIKSLFKKSKDAPEIDLLYPGPKPPGKTWGPGESVKPVEPKVIKKPWFDEGKKHEGKGEHDKAFVAFMALHWKRFGLGFKTIIGSTHAWCGLGAGMTLVWAGMQVHPDAFRAKSWDTYGVAIEWKTNGIPQGAFLRTNGAGDCKSASGNHITQANGDCAPEDLLKTGATIDGYGANQGDKWKVSTYSMKNVCAVRWPKDFEKPPRVVKSVNCAGKKSLGESTR